VTDECSLLRSSAQPWAIVAGSDGALWLTEAAGNRIVRMDTSGQVTEYPIPTAASRPYDIVEGAGGAFWFVEFDTHRIGRLSPVVPRTLFEFPVGGSPPNLAGIATGPDGNLWFAVQVNNTIGRV